MGTRDRGTRGTSRGGVPPPFPMPNAQCPMPNAHCPMPNSQFPIPNPSAPKTFYQNN
ncbi:hypothetical protein [Tolypothrix sp. VBCCA 56010]|uniref:hypothetical protein n=1 Tax=Tolypothrix sp. VBCCA 56010 TaxID=3137731 RepID=UPI003D7C6D04